MVAVSECSDVATNFQACGGDPTGTWTFKDVCFPSGATCDQLDLTPSGSNCVSSEDKTSPREARTMDYAIDGTNIMITNPDGKVTTNPFCVAGNTMTLKADQSSGGKILHVHFVLQRQ